MANLIVNDKKNKEKIKKLLERIEQKQVVRDYHMEIAEKLTTEMEELLEKIKEIDKN